MNVFEAIARAIADEDVGAIFTLVGNANMDMLTSLDDVGGPPLFHARHEAIAVGMAEGYAKATGSLGVCSVTSGPALANTCLSLTQAVRSKTPLLLVTGRPGEIYSNQHFPQKEFAQLVGAGYEDVPFGSEALTTVRSAFYRARTERRPIVLDVSRAVQRESYDWPYDYQPSTAEVTELTRVRPDEAALDEAQQIIRSSSRPIIIAGEGAIASGAREDILALARETGALLATSLNARNWFSDDPFNIGTAGLYSWKFAGELFAESDCIIAVGASMNHYTIEGGYLFPQARTVHIDQMPQRLMGDGHRATVYVQGDARTVVRALRGDSSLAGERYRTQLVLEQIGKGRANVDPAVFEIEPGSTDPRRICEVLDERFPRDAAVVLGGGHSHAFSIMHMQRWREPQLGAHHFAAIGVAFPIAVGAAIGCKDRPLLFVEGDGGLMMHFQAFEAAVRYELPMFIAVLDDSAFGSEYHQLMARGRHPGVSYLPDVDFPALARSYGGDGALVRSQADLEQAIDDFLGNPRPFVCDVSISRNVVSVTARRLHFGVEA